MIEVPNQVNQPIPSTTVQAKSNAWTKWWWIKVHQSMSWDSYERRAASTLGLLFVLISLGLGSFGFELADAMEFALPVKIMAGIFVGVPFGIFNARGIASEIFPLVVRNGDDASAKRLVGSVVLPSEEFFVRRLWWLARGAEADWTAEERWTRNAICGFAAGFLLVPLPFELPFLAGLEFNKKAIALFFTFVQMPLTLYVSRRLCVWLWPDYVRQADNAAVKRSNRNVSPRP
jgi:hypothetical protein